MVYLLGPNSAPVSFTFNETPRSSARSSMKSTVSSSSSSLKDVEKGDKDISVQVVQVNIDDTIPLDDIQHVANTLRSYLVVLGAFASLAASFGWVSCTGLFQAYYQETMLRDQAPSTVAWISSTAFFLMYFGGLLVSGVVDKYGCRGVILAGSILHVGGILAASFGSSFPQLLLAQGICSPLGCSLVFFSSVRTACDWFSRRMALVLGVSAAGASLGGVIFPLMAKALLPQIGFAWTMRACALLVLFLVMITNVTMSNAPHWVPQTRPKLDLRTPFKDIYFVLLAVGAWFFFNGYFTSMTFVVEVAYARGWTDAIYSLVVLNAASLFGRIIPGYFADTHGRLNITILMAGISTALTLGLWLPCNSLAASICYSVFYGFSSGSIVALTPVLALSTTENISEQSLRVGITYALMSVAALMGSPLGGRLITANMGQPTYLIAFIGAMQAIGTLVLIVARWYKVGFQISARV